MKVITSKNKKHVIRFDAGDEVLRGLEKFCAAKRIKGGYFFGIGACNEVVLSYFDVEKKQYEDHRIKKPLEIISLTGNVALFGKECFLHAHGCFGDRRLNAIAGHVRKIVVSATCEIFLVDVQTPITRKYSPETGLKLLN